MNNANLIKLTAKNLKPHLLATKHKIKTDQYFVLGVLAMENKELTYDEICAITGIAGSMARASNGPVKSLIQKGLIEPSTQKRYKTFAKVFKPSQEGWNVLHVLMTGELRKAVA